MAGIMLKDLKEAFCLRKNTIAWIFSIIVYLILVAVMPTMYVYVLCVTVMFPMIGVSILQYSNEQDEISKFDKIMLTYPITKKEIILSKYLSGMLLQVVVFLLDFIMALVFSFGYKVIDFSTAMGFWFVGIIFSFLFMAINYMMFMWLGNKKGTIMYVIFILILAVVYIVTYYNVDVASLFSMNRIVLLVVGFALSILAVVGSYFASVKIYTRKHIK